MKEYSFLDKLENVKFFFIRPSDSIQNDNIEDPYLNLMNKFKVEEEGDYIEDYLDLYSNHINSLTKQLDDKEIVNALSHQSVSLFSGILTATQTTNKTIDSNWDIKMTKPTTPTNIIITLRNNLTIT